jgi:hypothetical protein
MRAFGRISLCSDRHGLAGTDACSAVNAIEKELVSGNLVAQQTEFPVAKNSKVYDRAQMLPVFRFCE